MIENEEESLRALRTHMQEMNATLEALKTLPDKITHDVMVPFGSVAMFPGWCYMPGLAAEFARIYTA